MDRQTDTTAQTSATIRGELETLLDRGELSIVFQPIVDLASADIAGYEALTRPDHSAIFPHAGALFEAAERHELYEEVEALARRKAIELVSEHDGNTLLFLNNSAPVFTGPRFVERLFGELSDHGTIPPQRVVLEITERTAQTLIAGLSERSAELQHRGFGIALDDVGAGISGLNQIMSLRPNWMKLDIALIAGIDLDPLKQNLIRFFVHFAKLADMKLVAEGIERDEELRVLVELGVSHGQGFYLSRPGVLGADLPDVVRSRIIELGRDLESRRLRNPSLIRIASLAAPMASCDLQDRVHDLVDRYSTLVPGRGIVVKDGLRYVGWLTAEALIDAARDRGDDRIADLTIVDCPLVGPDITLAEALEIVGARPEREQTLPLIVQEHGAIRGGIALRQLLLAAADAQRRTPSHVAPLTGLPTRVHADRWIASHIKAGDPCDIAFIDLRDFDAYNAACGVERGDRMLKRLVGLAQAHLVDVERGASFFAHLGDDRFMLAMPADSETRLESMAERFERIHGEFFSAQEIESGGFECTDPFGQCRRYPLTTLRVIYLPRALQHVFDAQSLHFIAGRLRLRSSGRSDGRVLADRRRGNWTRSASA